MTRWSRVPARVIQAVLLQDVAARAWVDVRAARGFFGRHHAVANGVGLLAGVGERVGATLQDRSAHEARVEQREPLTVEAPSHLAAIAGRLEALPVVVQRVG